MATKALKTKRPISPPKPAPRYKVSSITYDEISSLVDNKANGWIWFVESNHRGQVYWNTLTGEIIWEDEEDEDDCNIQRLLT